MGVNSERRGLTPFCWGLGQAENPVAPSPARCPQLSPIIPKSQHAEMPGWARDPQDPHCPQRKGHTLGLWRELEAIRENYEERAAIMEFDGGLTRREAEACARRLTGYEGA